MRRYFHRLIDLIYPLFSRWISLQTYRYLAFGSINAGLGVVFYFIIFNYILHQQAILWFGITISAPVATQVIESVVFCISGFFTNKYLVFSESNLKGRIQLFRYVSVYVLNFFLNIGMIKVLVETFFWYPTIAKAIATLSIAVLSYISSKKFSFRNVDEKSTKVSQKD